MLQPLRGQAGRTLVELIVAMAILTIVSLLITGAQINMYRWEKADQRTANLLRPLREGADRIATDIEIAMDVHITYVGSATALRIFQVRDGVDYTITYWQQGTELMREQERSSDGAIRTQTVAFGLAPDGGGFLPDWDASERRAQIRLEAQDPGDETVARTLAFTVAPRTMIGAP